VAVAPFLRPKIITEAGRFKLRPKKPRHQETKPRLEQEGEMASADALSGVDTEPAQRAMQKVSYFPLSYAKIMCVPSPRLYRHNDCVARFMLKSSHLAQDSLRLWVIHP
jgi:hypothetical protein